MHFVNDLSIQVMTLPILADGLKSHSRAVFNVFARHNRVLAAPAVVPTGLRYGSLQKPNCGVARNVCGCVSTTSDFFQETDDAKGHRQMVQFH